MLSFSASQSMLHREVLNTALLAGEGWREPFKLPSLVYIEVKSKVEKTVCKL